MRSMESMESLAQDNKTAASRRAQRKPRGGQAAPGEYSLYNIKRGVSTGNGKRGTHAGLKFYLSGRAAHRRMAGFTFAGSCWHQSISHGMAFGTAGQSLLIHLAMRSPPVWQPSAVHGTREESEQGRSGGGWSLRSQSARSACIRAAAPRAPTTNVRQQFSPVWIRRERVLPNILTPSCPSSEKRVALSH